VREKEKLRLARYRGPVCRLCRREGMKLFLKGERCHSDKCAIERRNFVPGQHGKDRKAKLVGYGLQLREKQKVRRIFGVLEAQFRNTFEKAVKMKGITGENLLGNLERRLDSVIYRMGLGTSRAQARQIVRHGHIQVNGRKVNIPSFVVKPGDEIAVRESSRNNPTVLAAREATAHAPSPSWMDVDRENLRGKINSVPRRDEMTQIPINEQLIVELYSK
jgi:small subunit ribosomal protein S4